MSREFNCVLAEMYPSEEEEDTADSSAVQNNQESAITDQETEIPLEPAPKTAAEQNISSIFGEIETFCKIRKSKSAGCSPKKPKSANPKDYADTDPIDPDPVSVSPYLFDVSVTSSDCLRIPYKVAAHYFPASTSNSLFSEQTIQLTDPRNRHWPSIGYVCFDSEKAFILTHNWIQYACNLQFADIVRFVRPNPCFGNNHFMTQHLPRPCSKPFKIRLPVFLPQNFHFEVKFGQGDLRLGIGRLAIDADQVKKHFRGIRTKLKQEMVKLTDCDGTDWFVKMVYSGIGDQYILMDDQWEGFVREHELVVGDLVLFYKPNIHSHDKHFLIQFVKSEKSEELTDPGKSDHVSADDNEQTQEEQLTSQLASVLPGMSAEDLATIQKIYGCDGMKSIDEFMMEQNAYEGHTTLEPSSETAEQMIASIFREAELPEIVRTETETICKVQKSQPAGFWSKKPKSAHPKDSTDPDADSNSNSDSLYLFDVFVTNSDCLPIPYKVAADYFPPSSSNSLFSEQTIQLTDPRNRYWPSIGYVCFDSEKAFILTRNWFQYECLFSLQFMDIIRFVRPNPSFGNNHFMTQHLPRPRSVPVVQIRLPSFLSQNFLFEVEFGQGDVRLGNGRLVIDADQVKENFRGIRTKLKQEMVKLTDYEGTDWFVKMVYSGIGDQYILMDDQWHGFVEEHGLAIGDWVQFFKPKFHFHDKHFLIQFVKREKGDGLTKPGKNDCVSDDNRTTKIEEEQNKHSLSLVPPGMSDDDLLALNLVMSEYDGTKSIDEIMKEQQKAIESNQQINVSLQMSATIKLSQKEIEPNQKSESNLDDFDFSPFIIESWQKENGLYPKDQNKLNDSDTDSFGSDPDDEENQSLVFELEIIENDRLIIPTWLICEDFPLLDLNPDLKETLQLTDYLGHKWKVTLSYDSALDSYVITDGWSFYIQHYRLKYTDRIRCYRHVPQQNPNNFLILHRNSIGKCLFRVVVPKSNRLRIFFNRVKGYLNPAQVPAPHHHLNEYIIHVTDYLDQTWEMKLVRFQEEEAYVVVQGWEQYVAKHGLRHKDRISFCSAKYSTKRNSFLIYHELRRRPESVSPLGNVDVKLPLFVPENIICELCLSEADVGFGRLLMPGVEIPFLFLNQYMVKLTDENDKDWFMIIVKVKEGYMITDGWEGYVKEFELEAGDMVTIYSPACADHNKHFLIKCEKKKKKKSGQEEDGWIGSGNSGEAASPVLLFDFFDSSVG